MKSIAKFVRYFRRDQAGITTIEYAMIAAVIAIGVIVVGRLFGAVGLIVSVPILAAIVILVDELWVKPMEARALA